MTNKPGTKSSKFITIRFEVPEDVNNDEFLEAITKVVHEETDEPILLRTIDVQDNDNPVE